MKPVLVQGGKLPDSFDRGSRFWQLANCVMEICTQKALPLHSLYSCTHVNHCYVVTNPLDPFQCSSLQTNMATLRGCSCCVNQGVGGFTLPGVLCCKLFTHHCPATSHSHCPTTSHSHCPTTSRSHCPATSHSNCPISLLDTVLARQPYCSCPPHGQCALFRNWALSPGVVLNLKVGCMTRRLRKF